MTEIIEIINEVNRVGVTVHPDPPDLVLTPKGRLSPELKERVRKHKAEILRHFELQASMRRLEAAGVMLAISEDGILRIVTNDNEAHQATADGFTIYSPQDMYHYVTLSPSERLMLHSFKKRFGGTTEWRKS